MANAAGKGGNKQPKPGAHPGGNVPGSRGGGKGKHPAANVKGSRARRGGGAGFAQPGQSGFGRGKKFGK